MKLGRLKGLSVSSVQIAKCHEQGAIVFLWTYDLLKFWLLKDILAARAIDPVLFLFYDMVTVPPFIIGSARLVNALAGKVLAWPKVLGWGAIVLVNTFLPYAYAALAGEANFTARAWAIFWGLVLLVLANLVRTVRSQVIQARVTQAGVIQAKVNQAKVSREKVSPAKVNRAHKARSKKKLQNPKTQLSEGTMGNRIKNRVPSSSVEVNPASPFR